MDLRKIWSPWDMNIKEVNRIETELPVQAGVSSKPETSSTNRTGAVVGFETGIYSNIAGSSNTAGPDSTVSDEPSVLLQSLQGMCPVSQAMWPNKQVWQYMTLPFTITSPHQNIEPCRQAWQPSVSQPCKLAKYFTAKWQMDQAMESQRCGTPIPEPSEADILYSKETWPYIKKMSSKRKSKQTKSLAGAKKKGPAKTLEPPKIVCPSEQVELPKEKITRPVEIISTETLQTSKIISAKPEELAKEKISCPVEIGYSTKVDTSKQNALNLIFKKIKDKKKYHDEKNRNSRDAGILGKLKPSTEKTPRKEIPLREHIETASVFEHMPLYKNEKGNTSEEHTKPFKIPNQLKDIKQTKRISSKDKDLIGAILPSKDITLPRAVWPIYEHKKSSKKSCPSLPQNNSKAATLEKHNIFTNKKKVEELDDTYCGESGTANAPISKEATMNNQETYTKRNIVQPVIQIAKKPKLSAEAQLCENISLLKANGDPHQEYGPTKIRILKEKAVSNQNIWTIRNKATDEVQQEPSKHSCYPKILITKEKTANNKEIWTIKDKVKPAEEIVKPKGPANVQQSVKVKIDLCKITGASKIRITKEKSATNKDIWTIKKPIRDPEKPLLKSYASSSLEAGSPKTYNISQGIIEPNIEYWIKKEKLDAVKEDIEHFESFEKQPILKAEMEDHSKESVSSKIITSKEKISNNQDIWIIKGKVEPHGKVSEKGQSSDSLFNVSTTFSKNAGNLENAPKQKIETITGVLEPVAESTEILHIIEPKLGETEDSSESCSIKNSIYAIEQDASNSWVLEMTPQEPEILTENPQSEKPEMLIKNKSFELPDTLVATEPYEVPQILIQTKPFDIAGPSSRITPLHVEAADASGLTHLPCAYQEELLRSLSTHRIRKALKLHEALINQLGGVDAMPDRKVELEAVSRELILEFIKRKYMINNDGVHHLRMAIMRCLQTEPTGKDDDEVIKNLLRQKKY